MSTTQASLGNALFQSLVKMRGEDGSFNMEDVGALFQQLASNISTEGGVADRFLRAEIEKLAKFIDQAKNEVSAMGSDGDKLTGDASQHLDAIVKSTEEATHTIMDAVDAIQNAASGIGGEKEQAITDATMKIYEACNFQDLTGQRVTKIVGVLTEVDKRIDAILGLFGSMTGGGTSSNVVNGNFTEKDLLNGPQLPSAAPSQADIDALFASFKP